MIKNVRLLLLVSCIGIASGKFYAEETAAAAATNQVQMSVAPQAYAKVNVLIGVIGADSQELREVIEYIKYDLEFSGQFNVAVRPFASIYSKQEMQALGKEGYTLAVFINEDSGHEGFEWRIYDIVQATMVQGKRYVKRGTVLRGWAHNLADSLWACLTGQEGFFSTKIAYCKDVKDPKRKAVKHIYVADFDGSNSQRLVTSPTVNIAPRWNQDKNNPLLFYSEYTNKNVRLAVSTMDKKQKITSNYDGINMLPCFTSDGKKVVYCASRGDGSCQIYYYEKGLLKKLTHNQGNNVSPTLSEEGSAVYFCSDFQTGQPQIYCYHLTDDKLERLTDSGYCASPSYCSKNNKIAYSRMVNGTMQIFVFDCSKKTHTQFTFDKGNKEESSWSPCGTYIAFSLEEGKNKSRIALMNTVTNERRFITVIKDVCSYPAWSPTYNQLPVVIG